jgi:hypothetical protein
VNGHKVVTGLTIQRSVHLICNILSKLRTGSQDDSWFTLFHDRTNIRLGESNRSTAMHQFKFYQEH